MSFSHQLQGLANAILLIKMLPDDTVWAVHSTDDNDNRYNRPTLNIYMDPNRWNWLRQHLKLGKPVEENRLGIGEDYITFHVGLLSVSLIEPPEGSNGRNYQDGRL